MENSDEKIANEIKTNFKMIMYGCIVAIAFIGLFYISQKPPVLSNSDLISSGKGTMSIKPIATKYDDDFIVPNTDQISSLNNQMQRNFEDDLKNKSGYAFLICISLFLIGRYVIIRSNMGR